MGITQKMLDAINNARNSMISGINSPNPVTGAMAMGGVDPLLLVNMSPQQISQLQKAQMPNAASAARREATGPDTIFAATVRVHKVSNGYTVTFDNAQRSEIYIADNLAKVHDILVSHMTAQRLES